MRPAAATDTRGGLLKGGLLDAKQGSFVSSGVAGVGVVCILFSSND